MDNPRAEKVAVVDEVRERLSDSSASVVTEYRGLTVGELAELRRSLAAVGGDYKIFKNTLVRLAVAGGPHQELEGFLSGPTAIAFVHGDVSAVAKALRDFSRGNPHLVMKGGLMEGSLLSAGELAAIADLPPRDLLLALFAGALAAPLRQLAGLLEALPRNMAYGVSALLEERRAGEPAEAAPAEPPAPEAAPAEAASTEAPEAAAESTETAEAAEAASTETPAEAAGEDEAATSAEAAEATPSEETADEETPDEEAPAEG